MGASCTRTLRRAAADLPHRAGSRARGGPRATHFQSAIDPVRRADVRTARRSGGTRRSVFRSETVVRPCLELGCAGALHAGHARGAQLPVDPQLLEPDRISHRMIVKVPQPYLLFLGDATDERYAKTAFGLRDWASNLCIGELALPAATITTGLPRLKPAEAYARGARSVVIGIANYGGVLAPAWIP